jgi:hypothetical protein
MEQPPQQQQQQQAAGAGVGVGVGIQASSRRSNVSGSGSKPASWSALLLVVLVLLMVGSSVAGVWALLLLAGQIAAQFGVFVGQEPPVAAEGPMPECTLKWS